MTPGSTPSPVRSSGTPSLIPSRRSALGRRTSSGNAIEVLSRSSRPTMWRNSSAASVTSRVSGPAWSSDEANAIIPKRLHAPYVGLRPTIPHRAAGWRIDPPGSGPSAHGPSAAATGAGPEPPRPERARGGGGAAATRAAGHARAIPRVEHRPEGRVLVRRAHRELVLFRLAEQWPPRLGELAHDRRGVRRAVALEDLRARLRGHALGPEE